ncbi:hypothetical protein ACIQUZ_27155 [Streptomyces griseus]|uniref:hypothetical protein n=1 Tax=Streptomyces TaxID=1883 RepID=UPI0001C19C4E|nr:MULTISPECIES: hypothetical protein [Streptomyces]EGE42027.1 hypothetical protein SACT1_2682 [Streptomyces sp. ACT-1]MYR50078.1 hypothetical protein [Streptomyces sp. SID4928]
MSRPEPHVGWTAEQRAAVKRYLQFAAAFGFVGIVLSVFLIASGNSGGWALLGIIGCVSVIGWFFIRRGRYGPA